MVSVGRPLAQLELTFQKPLFRGLPAGRFPRRALVEAGIPEDPRLGEEGKRRDFFEDESGVRPDFYRGTAWAAKGKTPAVRVRGQRFSLNMLSALCPQRGAALHDGARGGRGLCLHRVLEAPDAGAAPQGFPHRRWPPIPPCQEGQNIC